MADPPKAPTNPVQAAAAAAAATTSSTSKQRINPAFRYLGIPPSVLAWRPRAPSRNVSIFLAVTVSLAGTYVYDRRECKRLKADYIERVRRWGEETVPDGEAVTWSPRKVTVYGVRTPEDVDVDRGAQWFRKYVKPILVAAAVDYKIVNGVTPGGLGRKVAEDIHQRRIIEAALAKEGRQEEPLAPGSPGYRDWNEREHRQSGGSILMGRGALKEYLWGLRRGYLDPVPLDGLETEERLSQYLEKTEDVFADSSPPSTDFANDDDVPVGLRGVQEELARSGGEDPADWAKVVAPSTPPKRGWLSSLFGSSPAPHPTPHSTSSDDAPVSRPTHLDPLHHVPPQPALLLVPFDHPIGMKWWPLKLLHFFNHRARVRAGGEAAIALICNETESLIPPRNGFAEGINPYLGDGGLEDESMVQDAPAETRMAGETGSPHLDFGLDTEPHTYRGYASLPATLLSARRDYLASLPPKLATARQLARGEREPTKDEGKYPPPTEVELRAERVKKERKWREDRQGWEVVRKGSGVVWDERMEGALTVVQKGRMVDEVLGQKQQ